MSERLTQQQLDEDVRDLTGGDLDPRSRSVAPVSVPTQPKKPGKELSPDISGRNDSYAGMTIGEALILIASRRGESKKEKARLMDLLEHPGISKKSTIAQAREQARK